MATDITEPYSRIDSYHGKLFTYEDLALFTDNFSDENYIGRVQFGRVFRGKIPPDSGENTAAVATDVTVKIWEKTEFYFAFPWHSAGRLTEEVLLLKHWTMEQHPHLVKLIGYCNEGENVGIVYDLKPLDSLHNLMTKDNFSWIQRIKVALEFACLVEYFHAPREPYRPYLLRNISAAHIMLDEDYNSKLFDFSMIAGGIFPERRDPIMMLRGCHGYSAKSYISSENIWSKNYDVFAFGVILLCLISKRIFDLDEHLKNPDILEVYDWAESEYEARKSIFGFIQSKFSLVHPRLKAEPEFYPIDGPKITKLAMRCLTYSDRQRPTMKQVIDYLLNLHVVRRHANILGIQELVRGRDLNPRKVNLGKALRQFIFKN